MFTIWALKKRDGWKQRIELIRQPTGRRYWVRRDGKYSTLGSFMPDDHFLRKVDRIVDRSLIRNLTAACCADGKGRPSIDPVVWFRMQLVAYFSGIGSDRGLCEEARVNLAYCGCYRKTVEAIFRTFARNLTEQSRKAVNVMISAFRKRTSFSSITASSTITYLAVVSSLPMLQPLAAADTRGTSSFVEGFESVSDRWQFHPAKEHAQIKLEEDLRAPDGTHVLHFSHKRTTTSKVVSMDLELAPYCYYLVSFHVRRGKHYLRSGMGLWLRFLCGNKMQDKSRLGEHNISEEWQPIRSHLVTGESGNVRAEIHLVATAGDVFIDNFKIEKCSRDDLLHVLGRGTSLGIPQLAKPSSGEAAPAVTARVWWDEIPVSQRVPSEIVFQLSNRLLPAEVWNKSRAFKLELPKELQIIEPQNVPAEEIDQGGFRRYSFTAKHIERFGRGNKWWCRVIISQSEPLGAPARARFWAQWEGAKQSPVEVSVLPLNIPVYEQPKTILAGCQSAAFLSRIGDEKYAQIVKSLGFNYVTSWGYGKVGLLRQNGIRVDSYHGGLHVPARKLKKVPGARSIDRGGNTVSIVSPAHRGELFQGFADDVARLGKSGYSGVAFDDEYYRDWRGMDIDFSPQTKEFWTQWLKANRPDLKVVMPESVLKDPLRYKSQYDAWWKFKQSLITEWYAAAKTAFVDAVNERPGESGEKPWFAFQSNGGEAYAKESLANYNGLLGIFDRFSPQLYMEAYELRKAVRDLIRVVGKDRAVPMLCMGQASADRWMWKKGEMKAQILEVLFAGAGGYTSWGWHYSNLRVVAECAETNGAIAQNEDLFLDGQITETFHVENEARQFASVLETDKAGLLLVSNYTKLDKDEVVVRKFPRERVHLTDVFTGESRTLTAGQEFFTVKVDPDACRLFRWQK